MITLSGNNNRGLSPEQSRMYIRGLLPKEGTVPAVRTDTRRSQRKSGERRWILVADNRHRETPRHGPRSSPGSRIMKRPFRSRRPGYATRRNSDKLSSWISFLFSRESGVNYSFERINFHSTGSESGAGRRTRHSVDCPTSRVLLSSERYAHWRSWWPFQVLKSPLKPSPRRKERRTSVSRLVWIPPRIPKWNFLSGVF